MLPLGPHDVHLWLGSAAAPPPAELALLEAHEHARAARYLFERDRARELATRRLVRRVLSRYAPVAPGAWRFAANRWGRPAIAAPVLDAPLHFNITHSAEAVLIAVARRPEVGVDVESHRPPDAAQIALQVFSTAERAWLDAGPNAERHAEPNSAADAKAHADRFLALWTLKEAWVKACGQGLSMPLQRLSVLPSGVDGARLEAPADLEPDVSAWRFLRGVLAAGWPWAVAVRDRHARLTVLDAAAVCDAAPGAFNAPSG